MATISNIIKTIFTSENADRVESDFIRLSRAQTRLGQGSVGAGRQFAAQASGLGGLVAAYAGAAATSFALQAAFTALANSARALQTIQGVDVLAAQIAQAGDTILTSVQQITNSQLTLAESASQVNLALSAGFNTDQIENLSEVALKASRALGRDLADSMTRVVRGSAKMETELLDELGIYTKIEPATRAYAAALGKSVGDLSEFERRQAFVNAVITEGQRKFSSINTTIPTAAEQIEAFGVKIIDMSTKLGGALAELIAPLASGIVDNVAASFGALGLVLSLVAGKGVSLLSASIDKLVLSMQKSILTTENKRRAKLGLAGVTLKATEANAALTNSTLRLNAAEAASFNKIKDAAAARSLSGREIKESNKLLKNNLQLLQTERTALRSSQVQIDNRAIQAAKLAAKEQEKAARALPQGGGFGTPAFIQRTTAINAARAAVRAATQAEQALKPALDANRAALTANMQAIVGTTRAIQANTAAVTGWRAVLAGFQTAALIPLTRAVSNLGAVFGTLLGAASTLFLIVSIFQLIGTAIANALGKGEEFNAFFAGLGKVITNVLSGARTKEFKNTMLGITGSALGDIEAVDTALKNTEKFSFRKKTFIGVDIEIEKTKEELVKEVSNILVDVGRDSGKTLGKSLTSSLALTLSGAGALIGSFFTPIGTAIGAGIGLAIGSAIDYFIVNSDEAEDAVENYGKSVRAKFGRQIAGLSEDVQDEAVQALSILQAKYGDIALVDPGARAAKTLQEELVLRSVESLRTVEAIGQVMASTAQSAADVNKNFDFKPARDGIAGIASDLDYVSSAITSLGGRDIEFLFVDTLNEDLKKILSTVTYTADSLNAITLEDLRVKIPNVDISDEDLQASLDSFRNKVNNLLGQGLTGSEFISELGKSLTTSEKDILAITDGVQMLATTLEESYSKVAGPLNSAQRGFILTTELLRSTNDELSRGVLTFEKFTQNTGNARSAIIDANKALADAELSLPAFEAAVRAADTDEQRLAAQELLDAEIKRIENLKTIANVNTAVLDELLSQESSIKRQIELTEFLKEQSKGTMSNIEFEFEIIKTGAANATAASADFFNQLISANKQASYAAAGYRDIVASTVDAMPDLASSLKPEQLGAVLSASKQSVNQLARTLQGIPGIFVDVTNNTITLGEKVISLVDQTSQDSLNLVNLSNDALKKLAQNALLEVQNSVKKFKDTLSSTITDITNELNRLDQDSKTNKIQFDLDLEALSLSAAEAARQFNISFKENQIKMIELQVDLKKISPVAGAEQINQLESDILLEQRRLLEEQKISAGETFAKESQLLDEKLKAEENRISLEIKATKDKIAAEYNLLKAAVQNYNNIANQLEAALVDGGNSIGKAVVNSINAGTEALISSLGPLASMLNLEAKPATFVPVAAITNAEIPLPNGDTISELELSLGGLDSAMNTTNAALDALGEEQKRYAKESIERERILLNAKRGLQIEDFNRQAQLLAQLDNISIAEAEKKLKEAAEAGGKPDNELNEVEKRLKALFDSIKGNIENALMGLNNLIFYGEGSFNEIMGSFFKNIQQDFFKTTIAEPVSDYLTTSLFSALGVDAPALKKGTDGLSYRGDSLLVAVTNPFDFMNPAADPTKLLDDVGKDGKGIFGGFFDSITGMFSKIFGQGGFISNLFGKLFGGDGILSGLFKGIGGFFSMLIGRSQGGLVHLAAGGAAASASLMRDRVPAMLEPGEFVIRKQSAQKIGMPALQAMNATGAAAGGGNVVVNMTNEGSPKQADASAPRFDGEKYVIDIVMRDIANNGPIRRSLRGRGGL